MSILNEAANIGAPREGRVIQLDITTSSQRFNVPAAWGGMMMRGMFTPDTPASSDPEYAVIVFGDSTVTAAVDQDSSVPSEDITINDTTGERFYEREQHDFVIPSLIPSGAPTDFAVIGSAAGKLVLTLG